MNWLIPATFLALTGSLTLVLVYLNLYLREREKHLSLWLASWSLYAVRFIVETLMALGWDYKILVAVDLLSGIWSAAFLLWGTCLFSGKKLNAGLLALFAGGSLWVIMGISFRFSTPWTTVPTFLLSAFASIFTGVTLLRFKGIRGPAKLTAGWAFVLWGLHKADYPLLRPLTWAAPLGYLLTTFFGFVSALSIILVYLEKTKEELKLSEEKYRSIFENAVEGIFQTTPDGRFLSANNSLARMYGYESPEQFVGSAIDLTQVYADPGDREKFQALIRKDGFVEQFETRMYRKGGEMRWVSMNVRAVKDGDGEIRFYEGSIGDVTDRRRAEEDLRISRLHLSSAADLARIAYWEHDGASNQFIFNDAFYALYATTSDREGGYRMAGDEYVRRFVHPDDAAALQRRIEENRTHPRSDYFEQYEHRVLRRDGGVMRILTKSRVIMDAEGWVVGTVGVNQDITESKKAEEALRRYELLSGNGRDIILFTEREGNILEANVAAEKAYGYSREELLGLNVRDLRAPETASLIDAQMTEADEQGILFETSHRRRDGSTFPAEVSSQGAAINGNRTLISVVRDISERKLAEMVLKESEESLRVFLDAVPHPALLMDRDGSAIVTNSTLARSLGVNKNSLKGQKIFDLIGPGIGEQRKAYAARIVETGKAVIFEDSRAGRDFVNHMYPVFDYAGAVARIAVFALDVTEAKSLQAQLIQAQKMEAIGTLAGGVAHDFNNILTVIMGLGNLIQMSLDPGDCNKPYIDQIVLSSERAADLTKSLLAYSRKQRISLEPHSVGNVIASTAKLLKRLLPEDVELKLDLADGTAVALLDISQVDQVLMNLATNARDAMPDGGSLTIRADVAQLDERFRDTHGFGKPGTYVRISVSDTGTGMDEKTTARIFEPFFTTKETGKGTGLGLASAYGIVKQHDGYIIVASALGKGTTFNIYLPLVNATEHTNIATTEVKGGSETILVLEDDPDVRKMMANILSSQGYTMLEAANGNDALGVFHKHRDRIGLVILDVVMPGKNGKEVFDEIARIDPMVKAIFMSGYTGDVVIGKGLQRDSVDFLEKPLSAAKLLAKIREVLDR